MDVLLNFSKERPKRSIPGFDGYFATYEGQILSCRRGKEEVKTVNIGKKGYCTVGLTADGTKIQQRQRIHRMVALAWLENPNRHREVNHKDGDKKNNCVKNLEWATRSQQMVHAHANGLVKSKCKAVCQADLDGNILAEFPSLTDAANKTNTTIKCISSVLTGRHISSKGYCWFYKDEKVKEIRGHGNAKIVQQFTLKGKFVAEYKSIRLAAEANNVESMSIVNTCKGKQKKGGGYIWRYKKHIPTTKELLWNETRTWAELKKYPRYRISRDGRIYSEKTKMLMSQQWSGADMSVSINSKGEKAKPVQVHRLVATAYLPNPKKLPVVNHLDSDPSNNNVENLEWATHQRNSQHSVDYRRSVIGKVVV